MFPTGVTGPLHITVGYLIKNAVYNVAISSSLNYFKVCDIQSKPSLVNTDYKRKYTELPVLIGVTVNVL